MPPRPPGPLDWLIPRDLPTLARRFALAEVLGPPGGLRAGRGGHPPGRPRPAPPPPAPPPQPGDPET